jgi:hypothetical protein
MTDASLRFEFNELSKDDESDPVQLDAEERDPPDFARGYSRSRKLLMVFVTDESDESEIVIACGGGHILQAAGKAPLLRVTAAEVNENALDRLQPQDVILALTQFVGENGYAGVWLDERLRGIVSQAGLAPAAGPGTGEAARDLSGIAGFLKRWGWRR